MKSKNKISQKKKMSTPLTLQTRDLSHQTGNTMYGKITKLNPQQIKH
jgi:hypothetical protein